MGPSTSHEAVGILMQPANTISKSFLWMHVHPDEPVYVFDTQVHTYIYIYRHDIYLYLFSHVCSHIFVFMFTLTYLFRDSKIYLYTYPHLRAGTYFITPAWSHGSTQDSWWFLHIYYTILRNMGRLEIRDALRLLSFLHGEMDDAPLAHAIFPNN